MQANEYDVLESLPPSPECWSAAVAVLMHTTRMCQLGTLARHVLAMDNLLRAFQERSRNQALQNATTARERIAVHKQMQVCSSRLILSLWAGV